MSPSPPGVWPLHLEPQDNNLLTCILADEESLISGDPPHMANLSRKLIIQGHRPFTERLNSEQFLILHGLPSKDCLHQRKPYFRRLVYNVHDSQKPLLRLQNVSRLHAPVAAVWGQITIPLPS